MGKKFSLISTIALAICSTTLNAQVTIGADKSPESFSVLELISNNTHGLRLPQLTTQQRDNITTTAFKENSLAEGLTIFNTDTKCVEVWNGTVWIVWCEKALPPCITGVTITSSAASADVGTTVTLTATLSPSGTTDPITWLWEYNTGSGWATIGTNSSICTVTLQNVGNNANHFRVTASNTCGNATSAITSITGTQPAAPSDCTPRITWDDINKQYILTYNPNNAGLYFRFGSVIGVYSGANGIQMLPATNTSSFDAATQLPWNLTGVTGTGMTGFDAIGSYKPADIPAKVTPEDVYHTIANVKLGKGDPCRLVGLDLNTLKTRLDANDPTLTAADIDNGQWRLPTLTENQNFVNGASGWWWTAASSPFGTPGVAGGEFPSQGAGGLLKFLPAAGGRVSANGAVNGQGTSGFYWSNEPYDVNNGLGLSFSSSLVMADGKPTYYNGYPIRCVKQ